MVGVLNCPREPILRILERLNLRSSAESVSDAELRPSSPTMRSITWSPDRRLSRRRVLLLSLRACDSISFTLTVPDGWETGPRDPYGGPIAAIWPAGDGFRHPDGMALGFVDVSSIESDPCDWFGSANDIAVGPSAADLATALSDQAAELSGEAAYTVSAPTDVSLGGYSGKYLEVTMPTEVFAVSDPSATTSDPALAPGCGGDQATYRIWDGRRGFNIYIQGPANRWQMWILDVERERVVVLAHDFPATSAEDRAELQAIVDSIRIER